MAPPARPPNRASDGSPKNPKDAPAPKATPKLPKSVEEKVRTWNKTGAGVVDGDSITTGSSDGGKAAEDKSSRASGSKLSASQLSESKLSQKKTSGSATSDESEGDKDEDAEHHETPARTRKTRPRSKTATDARIVWPSTPGRNKSNDNLPTTEPPKRSDRLGHNTLSPDIKRASAPKKRVISDGQWVKYRPKPESPAPPKPKPGPPPVVLANGPKGLAWVRPPLRPRKDSNGEAIKEKEKDPEENERRPTEPLVIKNYSGKMRKPILHQFDPYADPKGLFPSRNKGDDDEDPTFDKLKATLQPGIDAIKPGVDAVVERTISASKTLWKWAKTAAANDGAQNEHQPNRRRSYDNPDSDDEAHFKPRRRGNTTRDDDAEPDLRHQPSISKTPPLSYERRRRKTRDEPYKSDGSYSSGDESKARHEKRSRYKERSSIQQSSRASLDQRRTPPKDHKQDVHSRCDSDPMHDRERRVGSREAERRPSYNAGDMVPTLENDVHPIGMIQLPSRVEDWLSTTSDPFVSKPHEHKPKRTVSFESKCKIFDDGKKRAEDEDNSSVSTPSLKRNGARRTANSPLRERERLRNVPEDADAESQVTKSQVSEDTVPDLPFENDKPSRMPSWRQFPSTGKRLSTIVSVDTISSDQKDAVSVSGVSEATERPAEDAEGSRAPVRRSSKLNRSGTLRSKALSIRSTKSHYSRLADMSVAEVMAELSADEERYMPELRTLVGGVIPVLFKAVFSKSDAAVAAGLFSKFAVDDDGKEANKAIHEMGFALERLKSYHRRIPKGDVFAFVVWANGAHKIYTEYVRTWRLGFQDVVVNLVPADDLSTVSGKDIEGGSMADALPRNNEGYVVNQDGELVDVAFLLKRPLVRLKYLTKTIMALNSTSPSNDSAELVKKYEDLLESARRKVKDERARMEDQAAAQIDVTRARDPSSMMPISGVKVDPHRNVRARDVFDMHLIHTSGQEVCSRVELLIRDDPPARGRDADILICQKDDYGRWLFLPPVLLRHVSCRVGGSAKELVVMIRGYKSNREAWNELFTLTTKDQDIAAEWIEMLGTTPVPPAFSKEAIVGKASPRRSPSSQGSSYISGSVVTESTISLTASAPPSTVNDVPIGVKHGPEARRWDSDTNRHSRSVTPITTSSLSEHPSSLVDASYASERPKAHVRSAEPALKQERRISTEHARDEASQGSPLKRTRATRRRWSQTPEMTDNARSGEAQGDALKLRVDNDSHNRYGDHRDTSKRHSSAYDRNESGENEPRTPLRSDSRHKRAASTPVNRPSKAQLQDSFDGQDDDQPPPPPPHRTPVGLSSSGILSPPTLSPSTVSIKRRSSSPLKHEYRPSESEGSYSDESETFDESDGVLESSASEAEDDYDDVVPPPPPHSTQKSEAAERATAAAGHEVDTITPSQSASQGPFRDVPESSAEKCYTFVAKVSRWAAAEYVDLHPQECIVEVQPGKISAYEMATAAPDAPRLQRKKPDADPIVSLQLTPAVVVQSTNAWDVGVRSRPCADSRFRPATSRGRPEAMVYVRFHSAHPAAREALQARVCWAMANNPTYLALERARPKVTEAERFDAQNPGAAARREGGVRSWWSGSRRASSFRNTRHTRSGSTVGNTEATYRSSGASSLRRGVRELLARAGRFDIERSAIFSKRGGGRGTWSSGQRTRSLDGEGEDDGYRAGGAGAGAGEDDAFSRRNPAALQHTVRSARCRLLAVEDTARRGRVPRDVGRVTLHVLHVTSSAPPPPSPGAGGSSGAASAATTLSGSSGGGNHPVAVTGPRGIHSGRGLRVVLANRAEVLLDTVLPPSSFARSARGIAVHVFAEKTSDGGGVVARGGVGTMRREVLFLSDFETESMREWIFDTLSGQQMHNF